MTSPRAVPVPKPAEPSGGTGSDAGGAVRYSVPEAARLLGISERAIRKRIDAGTLFATREGRAWSVYLEEPERQREPLVSLVDRAWPGSASEPESGTSTADGAVPSEPTEPDAVPRSEPEPERAVPLGTGTAVDLSPLVALVDDLTRRNAELTEAATIWQFRARQLEEQIKQLTAGDPNSEQNSEDTEPFTPVSRSDGPGREQDSEGAETPTIRDRGCPWHGAG